jgi:hypothetical protein
LNPGFKTKSEEIQWRRAKIVELKSQGLDQREMAHVLHVSPTTITFDLKYLRKEARKTIREYTTEQLPLQLRIFMVANKNAIKQYWAKNLWTFALFSFPLSQTRRPIRKYL